MAQQWVLIPLWDGSLLVFPSEPVQDLTGARWSCGRALPQRPVHGSAGSEGAWLWIWGDGCFCVLC